jgi:hypothetical protein
MKYLVVVDMCSGFAEISNVLVVEANTEEEAKKEAKKLQRSSTSRGYEVYKLDDITTPWAFYW